jgi:hypothetical protein
MGRHRIARLFNLDLNSARRLHYYLSANGPPEKEAKSVDEVVEFNNQSGRTHMVIGDAHAAPHQTLRRFRWAALFAIEHRPEVIVSIGDWFGLDSLCKHHSAAEAEGLRLLDDLNAGNEAMKLFDQTLKQHNRMNPDDQYHPRLVVTLGNHDARIVREASHHPSLKGLLGYELMHWKQYGWEVIPFGHPYTIDGVRYCHFFTRGGSPRAISGAHHAATLVREGLGVTLVCGHSHQLHWYHKAGHDGRRVHGVVVGCFFEHHEDYAGVSNFQWWRGLVLLRNVCDGDFDLETWTMKRIGDRYGDV